MFPCPNSVTPQESLLSFIANLKVLDTISDQISTMPHTLVTGANSFVGVHIIKTLIDTGHTVTGSVRRASAGEDVLVEHPEWKGKLDFVEIADYATPGIWDAVFKEHDFDYIVHVASPMVGNQDNTEYDRDWLLPAVNGYATLMFPTCISNGVQTYDVSAANFPS